MGEKTPGINSELARVHELLERRISYKRIFMLGLVQGIGSAIGATIIAGIIIALLVRFVQDSGYFQFLEDYLVPPGIEKAIEEGS